MKRTLCAWFSLVTLLVHAGWTPPAKPDPKAILSEAPQDAAAGRFEDALAKHVWFHENALKFRESLYGVRLSFALGYWIELGKAYPPALTKLKSIRDQAEKTVRSPGEARAAFHDFVSINEYIKEQDKTRDLFRWLDSNKPDVAKQVFDIAEPALVQLKEYRLCGRYLDPDKSYQAILDQYKMHLEIARDPKFGDRTKDFGEKTFVHEVTTLIALLVINKRAPEADRIADKALKARDDPSWKQEIEKAKRGKLPSHGRDVE